MPGGRGFPSNPGHLRSSVLRYLDFGSVSGLVLLNIAAHYPRLHIPGGPEIGARPTRRGERRKAWTISGMFGGTRTV